MFELTFSEKLLEYLKSQYDFEEADIEAHAQMTADEKIAAGIIIPNASVIDSNGQDFILRVDEDNSKVRVGDKVKITGNNIKGIGQISDIGVDTITLTTDILIPSDGYINIEIMEFIFLQPMISLMEKIVDASKPGMAFIDILEGVRTPKAKGLGALPKPDLNDTNSSFNQMQRQVIEETCQRPSVYCIQGPPGTGKTAVLSEIARNFASAGKEVLVIANTHQAVNNALNKIASHRPEFNVVKIGETIQATLLFPNIYVADNYSAYINERKNMRIQNHGDVVGMTLHAAVFNLGLRNSGFKPQIVLVDEAGQIPMAYASVIGAFGCGSIVFIGDDKQMPPIFHTNLNAHPFSTSIFKFLCDKYPSLRKTLNVTYRMNDEISSFVSSSFYDSYSGEQTIISSEYSAYRRSDFSSLTDISNEIIKKILLSQNSFVIVNATPDNQQGRNCTDDNIFEASLLADITKVLQQNNINKNDYAIITPFRRQVKLIRSLIANEDSPLINTVECLQGQDVNTIFISFVSSNPDYFHSQLEFILNPNRLNVMISRAKTKVVMIMPSIIQQAFFNKYGDIKNSLSINCF